MRKSLLSIIIAGVVLVGFEICWAQTAPGPAMEPMSPAVAGVHQARSGLGLGQVISAGGPVGVIVWMFLFANVGALTYFIAECSMMIRATRIMPDSLVKNVTQAMEEGDVMKALEYCDNEPGPLANVLSAGFSNVEEGFETIQDMVSAAAEMESEKLLQRVTYLNVVSNLGPLLGLLGTVHGMINSFHTLATTQAGVMQQSILALNIAEALYCTATGLMTAIPALTAFYIFKNLATRIILSMEALTLNLIKSLRNVEVVAE